MVGEACPGLQLGPESPQHPSSQSLSEALQSQIEDLLAGKCLEVSETARTELWTVGD